MILYDKAYDPEIERKLIVKETYEQLSEEAKLILCIIHEMDNIKKSQIESWMKELSIPWKIIRQSFKEVREFVKELI